MRVAVCQPRDLGPPEITAWRAIQAAEPLLAGPFLSPEFALAADAVDERTRVAVIEDAGALIGFLPFRLRTRRIATQVLPGLAGAGLLVDPQAPPLELRSILARCGLAIWEFNDLAAAPSFGEHPHVARGEVFAIDLAQGSQQWLSDRRHEHRHLRRLEARRAHLAVAAGETVVVSPDADPGALASLLAWKSAQYHASGHADPFAPPAARELIERLSDAAAPGLSARLATLRAGGVPVAALLSLYSETVGSGWITAYDHGYARYSPGLLLMIAEAAAAGDRGVRVVELGSGDQDYKAMLANRTLERYAGFIERPSPTALAWRAARFPRERTRRFVLSHPAVRARARTALRAVGRLRGSPRR